MKNKLGVLVSLGALVILVGAGCSSKTSVTTEANNADRTAETNSANMTQPESTTETQPASETETRPVVEVKTETTVKTEVETGRSMLTMAEVAKHNVKEDCYIVVRDMVYDVTKGIDQHPGGPDKIIPLCGKDATAAFSGQHGGQPQPEAALASMKIGALQK